MYDPRNPASLEKYSSAITLSDMEVFIFPELLFALVLANIMSPALWKWKTVPWFAGMDSLNQYRRLLRTKQYIIDRFSFNLDLDTWGLTTKEKELARFSPFIEPGSARAEQCVCSAMRETNTTSTSTSAGISDLTNTPQTLSPTGKRKPWRPWRRSATNRDTQAGRANACPFRRCTRARCSWWRRVPLEKIYLMATPLHSQNFVDINDGIITNNRRIVTKNMWFNGTELSEKARRALQHERVTVVAHHTGHIHTLYDTATMSRRVLRSFSEESCRHSSPPTSTSKFWRISCGRTAGCKNVFRFLHRAAANRAIFRRKKSTRTNTTANSR